ncbi:MAG TPA: PKD domain-containing protein [Ferruginibacter sp.]|nr:PKD domain-containing protein [Ferruginibacter sp.]HPH90094.1 PKD domain-containing protein [Ferruginibacter sp.]
MKRNIYLLAVSVLIMTGSSCKKESTGSGLKAVFSYVADGYKVNFTNFSTNAKEYSWEFGDGSGETSTLKGPQHVFNRKGDFLVTLTATSGSETSTFTDTVSIIGPNIKIDGDFTDWTYVSYAAENSPGFTSSIRAIKAFASSDQINIYLEGDANMNMEIVDIYIDANNNPATGYATWLYPSGAGADFLAEGSPVGGWGDVFGHVGPGTGWGWTGVSSFAEALQFSELKTEGGKKIIEFSIKKSVLGNVSQFVNLAIMESNSGWTQIGIIPEAPLADAKFLAIPL